MHTDTSMICAAARLSLAGLQSEPSEGFSLQTFCLRNLLVTTLNVGTFSLKGEECDWAPITTFRLQWCL